MDRTWRDGSGDGNSIELDPGDTPVVCYEFWGRFGLDDHSVVKSTVIDSVFSQVCDQSVPACYVCEGVVIPEGIGVLGGDCNCERKVAFVDEIGRGCGWVLEGYSFDVFKCTVDDSDST